MRVCIFFSVDTVQEPLHLLFCDFLTMNKHTCACTCAHTHHPQSTWRDFSGNLENRRSLSLVPPSSSFSFWLLTNPHLHSGQVLIQRISFWLRRETTGWTLPIFLTVMCILKKKSGRVSYTHTPSLPEEQLPKGGILDLSKEVITVSPPYPGSAWRANCTKPSYIRDLSICGFWCPWVRVLEPAPCGHQGTTVLLSWGGENFLQIAPTLVYKLNHIHIHNVVSLSLSLSLSPRPPPLYIYIHTHTHVHTHIYYLITVETFLKLWSKDLKQSTPPWKQWEHWKNCQKQHFLELWKLTKGVQSSEEHLFKKTCWISVRTMNLIFFLALTPSPFPQLHGSLEN